MFEICQNMFWEIAPVMNRLLAMCLDEEKAAGKLPPSFCREVILASAQGLAADTKRSAWWKCVFWKVESIDFPDEMVQTLIKGEITEWFQGCFFFFFPAMLAIGYLNWLKAVQRGWNQREDMEFFQKTNSWFWLHS